MLTISGPNNAIEMSREISDAANSNGLSFISNTNFEEAKLKPCAVVARVNFRPSDCARGLM